MKNAQYTHLHLSSLEFKFDAILQISQLCSTYKKPPRTIFDRKSLKNCYFI